MADIASVDPERCQGHGRCYTLAPEIFEYDEEGFSRVRQDAATSHEMVERAARAAASCPERAIQVNAAAAQ